MLNIIRMLSLVYLAPMIITDMAILFAAFKLMAPNTQNRRNYIRLIYVSASLAMLAFLVIRLIL